MESKERYIVEATANKDAIISNNELFTFKRGEEKSFVEYMEEHSNYCQSSRNTEAQKTCAAMGFRYILTNSKYLDWEKVWEASTPWSHTKFTLPAFIHIFKNIDLDAFEKKIKSIDNALLVGKYYLEYAGANGLTKELIMQREYGAYLDVVAAKIGCSREEQLYNILGLNPTKNDEEAYFYAIYYLMDKVDFNQIIQKGNDPKISLKAKFIYVMSNINLTRKDLIVNKFLDLVPDVNFTEAEKYKPQGCNRPCFALMVNNYAAAFEAFHAKGFKVYKDSQVKGVVSEGDITNLPFRDNLHFVLKKISLAVKTYGGKAGIRKSDIIKLIYDSKIRIISSESLEIINSLLSPEEFNEFMLHIKSSRIKIYYYGNYYFPIYKEKRAYNFKEDSYAKVKDYFEEAEEYRRKEQKNKKSI